MREDLGTPLVPTGLSQLITVAISIGGILGAPLLKAVRRAFPSPKGGLAGA